MKRKSLLLTLLLALLVPWAANAYNHQVQVGNGTSGQNIAPINLYYNYSYTQQIYTAAQINGDCSLPGTIESISFYYAGSVTKTHPITVFMKTTEKTSFSGNSDWETVTESDIVYNDSWTVSTAGWVTITLNEPFAYDGESNLLIAIDKEYGDSYSNQSFRYTAVTNNQVIHYRSDSTNPDPYSPTTATGTSANLPNIQFNMTIAHPAPSALTLDEVVINTATISWTAPQTTNTITGYAYEYTDGETIETGTVTGTTANLSELTAATDYLFQVKAIYSDGESCWSEALDFTTLEACMTPENLTISDVTAHTATLTWTEGFGDGQWVLKYKLSTEEEYTNSVDVALADLPYTLTGLTAESTYNVQISPVCDATKTLTGNFTTTVACFAPTNLAVEANVQTATFTWESDVNDYEIAHATVATADPNDNIVGTATENTYSMSNLTIDTDHYFWVRSNCGSEGYSAWAGPASVHIGYCVPAPANVDGNGISNVTFGMGDNIVNNDTPKATYADYTNQTGAVQAGVESTIAITYATGYTYGTIIWVDFDNSLSFEDSEIVYTGTSTSNNPTTLEATFIIPATQTPGDYVMRIGGADSGFDSYISGSSSTAPSACYTGNWACFQDYTLRVLEAPSCLAPTGLTASDVTAHEATISWTSDASAWEIQLDEEEAIEVTEATYSFTGLTAETEYSVKVRTNCSGTYSDWTNAITFTTGIACPAPTGLAFTLTPGDGTVATFSWTENGSATAWQLCINGDEDNLIDMDENPFTYNGFTPEETYTAKVRAVCGGIDGESAWSNTVTFTPTDAYTLTVNDGTTTNSYVPVYGTWVDSYTKCQFIIPASELVDMQWGTISKMTFYSSTQNKTWGAAEFDILLAEVNNTTFESATLVDWADMDQVYHGAVSISDYKMEIVFDNDYQYMGGNLLVGFHQTVKGTYGGISWYGVNSQNSAIGGYESSAKSLSIQNFLPKTTFDYVPGEEPTCIKPTNLAVEYTGGTEAIVSWNSEATAWNMRVNGVEVNGVITNPYTLTGLELATTYAVEVQANCGDNGVSEWTNAVSFTTDLCMPENQCEIIFELTDSYGDGWNGAYIEVLDVATGSSLAQMTNQNLNGITGAGTNELNILSLAVCDGREIQFVWHSGSYDSECSYIVTDIMGEEIFYGSGAMSEPVNYTVNCPPTFTKQILGYGNIDNPGGYYLIASPIGYVNPEHVGQMTGTPFDLYRFNQENEDEWENYKTECFDLEPGKGYLYANMEDVTLTFVGYPMQSDVIEPIPLQRTEGVDWAGWNLVGNPFADTAYILDINGETVSFYTLNAAGSKLEPVESFTSIAPMEGVFVYAEQEYEILNFTTEEPVKGSMLILNMSNENGYVDRVMVRFDESRQLPKFMLNENDTKMYISKDDQDYAVVRSNKSGSLPVSFEPAEDGFYSISVNTENVLMKHLHLIDHKERVDVDLLSTPNYRFEAKTNDKPNRFELVFKTGLSIFQELSSTKGGDTEGFGFFSKGNWIIDNEGEAILQVIDVQGRILSSEEISGCVSKRIEAAPGVYMLRLINSEDVKVQKIVVE